MGMGKSIVCGPGGEVIHQAGFRVRSLRGRAGLRLCRPRTAPGLAGVGPASEELSRPQGEISCLPGGSGVAFPDRARNPGQARFEGDQSPRDNHVPFRRMPDMLTARPIQTLARLIRQILGGSCSLRAPSPQASPKTRPRSLAPVSDGGSLELTRDRGYRAAPGREYSRCTLQHQRSERRDDRTGSRAGCRRADALDSRCVGRRPGRSEFECDQRNPHPRAQCRQLGVGRLCGLGCRDGFDLCQRHTDLCELPADGHRSGGGVEGAAGNAVRVRRHRRDGTLHHTPARPG
jgi:hypothetical protein